MTADEAAAGALVVGSLLVWLGWWWVPARLEGRPSAPDYLTWLGAADGDFPRAAGEARRAAGASPRPPRRKRSRPPDPKDCPPMTADAANLVKAVLAGNPDACGALADALEEEGDPRGVLLRRRWRRWQTDRRRAEKADREEAPRLARARARLEPLLLAADRAAVPSARLLTPEMVDRAFRPWQVWRCDDSLTRYVRKRFPEGLPAEAGAVPRGCG